MKPDIPGRLHAQGLDAPRFADGPAVVRHLGAVQSQLHDMALWGVARRVVGGTTAAALQAAFDDARFLRTHVLRPTWHFVDPADLAWLQALTAPRVRRLMAGSDAELGIDDAVLDRTRSVVLDALADGPLTRTALADRLVAEGVEGPGRRTAHLMAHLELDALVASGPLQGRQHTYARLDPAPAPPDRDALLADLAVRYGRGHGPFRAHDLAWWSSITLTDARRAIDLAELAVVRLGDDDHAVPADTVEAEPSPVMLLPCFDEYASYTRDPSDLAHHHGTAQDLIRGTGLLFVDGRMAGLWRRDVGARRVVVTVDTAASLTRRLRSALDTEVAAFGAFLERPADLVLDT